MVGCSADNATNKSSHESGTEHKKCSDYSCCVMPLIVAFMLGAIMRQIFQHLRKQYFAGFPPRTVVLLLIGAAFGYICSEQGIREFRQYDRCTWISGEHLMHIVLPLLVFQPTFTTEIQVFKKSLNQVIMLAVTGYAIMVLATTALFYLIIFHGVFDKDWSLQTALMSCMFAVVTCVNDAVAVEDAVKVTGATSTLSALLQGEAIVGGGVAMILYRLFKIVLIHYENNTQSNNSILNECITLFVVECMFAPLIGIVIAMLTVFWLSRIYNDPTLEITIVLSVLHITYYGSEILRIPGMVTVLFFGLYLSSCRSSISHNVDAIMTRLFRVVSDFYTSIVYFYAGIFIQRDGINFLDDNMGSIGWFFFIWLLVNLLRGLTVFVLSPMLRRLGLGLSWQHTLTVWIAAVNGSYNVLLAMSAAETIAACPLTLHHRLLFPKAMALDRKMFQAYMIQVFLRQLVNMSMTRYLLRTFGLRSLTRYHRMSLNNAMRILKLTRAQTINCLRSDRFMADAAFDIVEEDTQTDDLFASFRLKQLTVVRLFRKVGPTPTVFTNDDQDELDGGNNRAESVLMLIKAQKKAYWRQFDRGLMSKEALHQLLEWADAASDHKGLKFLDVRQVIQASQVKPVLKTLKRQVRVKLRQLQHQKQMARGWLYWQQHMLPVALGYLLHLLDTLFVLLAITLELGALSKDQASNKSLRSAIYFWNVLVVGMYGMVTLGEILVMRVRFFKIIWHDIKLLIVVIGSVDLMLIKAIGENDKSDAGHVFIRLSFILSRLIRLLGLIETVPCILQKVLILLENWISGYLVVGFDICCAYVNGQVEVLRQLYCFVDDEDMAMDLKRHTNKSKLDIIRTLGILALEHPTIALSVKTRQAIRIVLNAQHDTVKQLKMEGALQETDCALLTENLEERMKKLMNTPPSVEDNSAENIIKNISWAHGDPQLVYFLQDTVETWIMKPNAIITEQGRKDFSIYIIRTGVARLECERSGRSTCVVDYMTAGNIMGEINFLTKSPRHKTIRCETRVSVMVLNEEVMEAAISLNSGQGLPPLLYRMWLAIAKRVALKLFLDDPDHQSMSSEHLRMKMANAYLMDNHLGSNLSIHSDPTEDTVLIHGHARDALTKQAFQGPTIVPRTCFQIELLPEEGLYTLLLVIPEEPPEDLEPAEQLISPSRRGSHIDPGALAVSASADALQLDEFLSHQIRSVGEIGSVENERKKSGEVDRVDSSSSDESERSLYSTGALNADNMDQEMVIQPSRRTTANVIGLLDEEGEGEDEEDVPFSRTPSLQERTLQEKRSVSSGVLGTTSSISALRTEPSDASSAPQLTPERRVD